MLIELRLFFWRCRELGCDFSICSAYVTLKRGVDQEKQNQISNRAGPSKWNVAYPKESVLTPGQLSACLLTLKIDPTRTQKYYRDDSFRILCQPWWVLICRQSSGWLIEQSFSPPGSQTSRCSRPSLATCSTSSSVWSFSKSPSTASFLYWRSNSQSTVSVLLLRWRLMVVVLLLEALAASTACKAIFRPTIGLKRRNLW